MRQVFSKRGVPCTLDTDDDRSTLYIRVGEAMFLSVQVVQAWPNEITHCRMSLGTTPVLEMYFYSPPHASLLERMQAWADNLYKYGLIRESVVL